MKKDILIEQLNAKTKGDRIAAIQTLGKMMVRGDVSFPERRGYTNNHVHTKYSFSPYSPAKAVWAAVRAGLSTVGIVDHDAINGAEEFIKAGEILGIATTIGFEMRADWSKTSLSGKQINNPNQISNGYICAHGLPHTQIEKADAFLSKVRNARGKRNRAMIQRLNEIIKPYGISVDYEGDVLPLSYAEFGGEVTERHLLFALADKMIKTFGKGQPLTDFITDRLNIHLSAKQKEYMADTHSDIYDYDLLNILKGNFVSQIYIDTTQEETPAVKDVVAFISKLGAIPTYCYLGDVVASPTGDKKAQKFEDDYLEDLFTVCKDIGFRAIAYMPSRNAKAQLKRVMALCEEYGFLQISGEDINQPRQSFICKQLKAPMFAHLMDTTWALVGHEISATKDIQKGMFWDKLKINPQEMEKRFNNFIRIGKSSEGKF